MGCRQSRNTNEDDERIQEILALFEEIKGLVASSNSSKNDVLDSLSHLERRLYELETQPSSSLSQPIAPPTPLPGSTSLVVQTPLENTDLTVMDRIVSNAHEEDLPMEHKSTPVKSTSSKYEPSFIHPTPSKSTPSQNRFLPKPVVAHKSTQTYAANETQFDNSSLLLNSTQWVDPNNNGNFDVSQTASPSQFNQDDILKESTPNTQAPKTKRPPSIISTLDRSSLDKVQTSSLKYTGPDDAPPVNTSAPSTAHALLLHAHQGKKIEWQKDSVREKPRPPSQRFQARKFSQLSAEEKAALIQNAKKRLREDSSLKSNKGVSQSYNALFGAHDVDLELFDIGYDDYFDVSNISRSFSFSEPHITVVDGESPFDDDDFDLNDLSRRHTITAALPTSSLSSSTGPKGQPVTLEGVTEVDSVDFDLGDENMMAATLDGGDLVLVSETDVDNIPDNGERQEFTESGNHRQSDEEAEKKRLAEEEAEKKRLAEEEAEKKQFAEEEAEKKRLAEEAEKKRLAEEEAKKKRLAEEEAEKKRLAEEEAEKKRLAEEEAEKKRFVEEEAEKKRLAEEEAEKKRLAEEAEKMRLAEEAEKKRLAEEAEKKRLAEEEAEKKRLAEEEAEKKRLAEEEAEKKRLAEEEAEKKRLAEEEAEKKRLAEEEAEKKRLAEEEAEKKRLAEEEAEKKRLAEEEAEKKKLENEAILKEMESSPLNNQDVFLSSREEPVLETSFSKRFLKQRSLSTIDQTEAVEDILEFAAAEGIIEEDEEDERLEERDPRRRSSSASNLRNRSASQTSTIKLTSQNVDLSLSKPENDSPTKHNGPTVVVSDEPFPGNNGLKVASTTSTRQSAPAALGPSKLNGARDTSIVPNEEEVSRANLTVNDVDPQKHDIWSRKLSWSVKQGQIKDQRASDAAKWVDKELRKLIQLIKDQNLFNDKGQHYITYGPLFKLASAHFEALSGTLKTAKKHKIVSYDVEFLFQGTHDDVVITLLKDTIPDSTLDTYTFRQVRQCSIKGDQQKGKGFSKTSLQSSNSKCHVCNKTVYPMEFVGAADKAFHKACFRCRDCGTKLTATTYCCANDQFFCDAHYKQAFMNAGDYSKGFGKKPSLS